MFSSDPKLINPSTDRFQYHTGSNIRTGWSLGTRLMCALFNIPGYQFFPTPLHPYTPTPLHPYTLHPYHPYTPIPLHPYTPTPLHPYTPTPLMHCILGCLFSFRRVRSANLVFRWNCLHLWKSSSGEINVRCKFSCWVSSTVQSVTWCVCEWETLLPPFLHSSVSGWNADTGTGMCTYSVICCLATKLQTCNKTSLS